MSGALDSICLPSFYLTKPVRNAKPSSRIVPGYCSLVADNIAGSALKAALPVEDYIIVLYFVVLYRAGIGAQPVGTLTADFQIYLDMRHTVYME